MPTMFLDGDGFRDLVVGARDYLREYKEEVDSLNVFPVPDGDTGTNMFLTLSSAADAVYDKESLSLPQVANLASQGALMGARGNSGVILSQIFRGLARYLSNVEKATPQDMAKALDEAVSTAYKAVMKPVEGTILSVLRAARDGAREVPWQEATIEDVLQSALSRGREMLAKTPDMLPVLKQAGVVDAGGMGLVRILEGALQSLSSESLPRPIEESTKKPKGTSLAGLDTADIRYPYDTQLLVSGDNLDISDLRKELESLGDSLLVVGEESLVRVHIHTARPGSVLDICLKHGTLSNVTIDNMVEQSQEAFKETRSAVGGVVSVASGPHNDVDVKETGIVSVATGNGLKKIMQSLGCDLVIDGGNTMNPSTADLTEAVRTVNAKKIIFFPNNGNIFLAAKQAKRLTGRNMYIVPSKTIPQGIAALLAINIEEDMSYNLRRAARAIKHVKTGEVTYAARDGNFGKHTFKQGDIIGLIDGRVECVGESPEEVLLTIVKAMMRPDDEIVTVYHGSDVSSEVATKVRDSLQEAVGDNCEVEIHDGGQPLYYYIVSVE
jgi:DAK2 domain fusion protein YloV